MWNFRGIKKKGFSTYLKNLILEHGFHFIGLPETMQQDISDTIINKIDPMKEYLWKWESSRGRSGGILVRIKLEFLDVGSIVEGEFMLHLFQKKKSNFISPVGKLSSRISLNCSMSFMTGS